jgi:4-hydroxyphenylpyruvate dioxygenase
MQERGFEPLEMTENYYHDLQARFSINDENLTRMKALNILYDEDQDGAFYQLYGKPFAGALFFEIVQRIDQYDGYGAANAPFRIVAQKRLMRPKGMPSK